MATPNPMPPMSAEPPPVDETLITYTNIIYALHALAVLVGLTTVHTVVFSFLGSLPSIVAVIMNYVRVSAVRGTFLESHFRWQIRTFWYALLWALVCLLLAFTIVGLVIALPGFLALGIWIIYRVARGWLALRDRRPMYV
ncbi:MAG: hypothetical protein JSR36_18810 [Proteobacteria bacterium]|nr:hypothetical protein [Pseudomonadota bacterium]